MQQRAAAVDRADRLDQLLRLDVLEQVAGRARAHGGEQLVVVDEARQHDRPHGRARRSRSRRIASIPSMRGITRSISTTSGAQLLDQRQRLLAVGRLADHLDVVLQVEERPQPLAHDRVVVGDQHPDHRGTSSVTVVPSPGRETTASDPPSARARSSIDVSPSRRERTPGAAGSKPTPSSATVSVSRPSRGCEAQLDPLRIGVPQRVVQRLLGDPQHLALDLRRGVRRRR